MNSRLLGTCYCSNSNFGYQYCMYEPAYYQCNGRTGAAYIGDRHPDTSHGREYGPDSYEAEPRACRNCGKVSKLLKRVYCSLSETRTYQIWILLQFDFDVQCCNLIDVRSAFTPRSFEVSKLGALHSTKKVWRGFGYDQRVIHLCIPEAESLILMVLIINNLGWYSNTSPRRVMSRSN